MKPTKKIIKPDIKNKLSASSVELHIFGAGDGSYKPYMSLWINGEYEGAFENKNLLRSIANNILKAIGDK